MSAAGATASVKTCAFPLTGCSSGSSKSGSRKSFWHSLSDHRISSAASVTFRPSNGNKKRRGPFLKKAAPIFRFNRRDLDPVCGLSLPPGRLSKRSSSSCGGGEHQGQTGPRRAEPVRPAREQSRRRRQPHRSIVGRSPTHAWSPRNPECRNSSTDDKS